MASGQQTFDGGKRRATVVVGLGETGMSCIRYLVSRGRDVVAMDSRDLPPNLELLKREFPQIRLSLGRFDETELRTAKEIVLSPGVSPDEPAIAAAKAAGVPVGGDIELFAKINATPLVAITGSNGKSTVTSWVAHIAQCAGLNAAAGGNLMPPALDLIDDTERDLTVLELSSFQLEATSSLRPDVSVLLNLSADHLDRHESLEHYAAAKARVYANARAAVVNRDDESASALLTDDFDGPVMSFGLDEPSGPQVGLRVVDGQSCIVIGDTALLRVDELGIRGHHNLSNALAACALSYLAGIPRHAMVTGLRTFRALPHRCELVKSDSGVQWINDSKGTNVGATQAALLGLGAEGPLVWLAGGQGKGADFTELASAVKRHVRVAILFGEDATSIATAIDGYTDVRKVDSLEAAIELAQDVATAGDTVLFSPACASFDMFPNYVARGERFHQLVEERVGS